MAEGFWGAGPLRRREGGTLGSPALSPGSGSCRGHGGRKAEVERDGDPGGQEEEEETPPPPGTGSRHFYGWVQGTASQRVTSDSWSQGRNPGDLSNGQWISLRVLVKAACEASTSVSFPRELWGERGVRWHLWG
ncbi:FSD1-like protein [Platysternon megacephalum]|uniref:FSD1-like protein n=1 Tax=Platysternon megacephalum TaxID=55544 RepID=A0A4D9E3S8_9SAUR|nr:FSD1-like protein [Platysternon megacephalum]